jgi:hypothetical protein
MVRLLMVLQRCIQYLTSVLPRHVWRIVASMFGPLTFSIADIGTRVAVWWAGNNSYYYGIVIAFREVSGRAGLHTVK